MTPAGCTRVRPFRALVWTLAVTTTACSGSATITRRTGPSLSGRIVTSEPDSLQIRDDDGGGVTLSRGQVETIDHPGNVLLVAGLVVLGMAAQIALEEPQTRGERALTGAIFGLPALSMIWWGGSTYLRSRQAASRFEQEAVRLRTPDPRRPYVPAPTWTPTAP